MQAIVDAINKGNIYYYIRKPWKGDELKVILSNALEMYTLREKTQELEKQNILAQFEILKNQINPHRHQSPPNYRRRADVATVG